LQFLVIEDCEADFRLIEHELRHLERPAQCRRVQSPQALAEALAEQPWDLVISDYRIPGMRFEDNLAALISRMPDVPVILVSGNIGEEKAVELLKLGTWDFVLKDKLIRLVSVVNRCLREAEERKDLNRARLEQAESEKQLQRSEQDFRTLAENSPDVIVRYDRECRRIYVNPEFERVNGLSAQEVLGKTPLHLSTRLAPMAAVFTQKLKEVMETGVASKIDLAWEKDGKAVCWYVRVAPEYDAHGNVVSALTIWSDITERKHAEDEYKKLIRAVEQSPVSIVITDRHGTIEYVNPRFTRVTGYSHDEAVGQNPRVLKSGETPAAVYRDLWQTILAKQEWRGELRNRRKNGELFWEEASISPVLDDAGEITHFIAVKEDITRRKAADEIIARHHEELERQVSERTGALAAALAAAEAADRAKDEFLANMSHEIRTPLNAVIGMANLALDHASDARQRDYLTKIGIAGNTLLAIVNDILDLSKIAADKMELEVTPFSLRRVIAHLVSVHGVRAIEKGLELRQQVDADVPDGLAGDPLRLGQIVGNLLSNAIKFTHAGTVTVAVSLATPAAGRTARLRFVVSDTGIGMSDEEVSRLFRPFTQADASITRNFGGTGLGLTISKKLAEAMGGSLSVVSESERGSAFTLEVELALTGVPVDEPLSPDRVALHVAGARVLVAEDQPMNREIAQELLQRAGIEVVLAENGRTAVDEVMRQPAGYFDAVLMDIQMPELDGITATRMIRDDPRHRALPIIAMTAHTMAHERQRCRDAGMNDHVGKPFSPKELFALLAQWIPERGQARDVPADTAATAAETDGFAALRGFDTQAALARFSGQADSYRKWLAVFADEAPAAVAAILAGLADGDSAAAAKNLHAFKGRAGMLGMTALQQASAELEAAMRAGTEVEPQAWQAEFESAHGIVRQWLERRQPVALPVPKASPPGADAAAARLRQVTTLIESAATAGRLDGGETRGTLLLIDDDPLVLEVIERALRGQYRTRTATTAEQGWALACREPRPDLILLDVELPDGNGHALCQRLKADPATAPIPVIFLSAHSEVDDVTRGLALGAVDYVAKPVVPPILLARVQTHLRLREAHDRLHDQNCNLEHLVAERTEDLALTQDLTIIALGSIAETRDNETGNHIHRTRAYMRAMCDRLALRKSYRDAYDAEEWALIWKSAPLHDIGKVGIPDNILLKPGRLTPEEFEIMKRHTVLGRDALTTAEQRARAVHSFLRTAAVIAYSHHERWDGAGYPEGLGGTDIPLAARLMSVADVYDALISKRVYKEAFSHETAVDIIRAERGRQFDPDIVDCFLDLADEFRAIALRFADAARSIA
jgi:PAS domain S-box-containing protein